MTSRASFVTLVSILVLPWTVSSAQDDPVPPRRFPLGEITERVESMADVTQSYAVYVPSNYEPARQSPILYVMDPYGRALVPLRLLRDAAERYGFIVVSSYEGDDDPFHEQPIRSSQAALSAMVSDTQRYFTLNGRRLYLAGLASTARAVWDLAYRLRGHVAGIIGFGGGLPSAPFLATAVPEYGTPFAFYGGAGSADLNFEELRMLDAALEGFEMVHRIDFYRGPHGWPAPDVWARAFDWMELQAMRAGLRPTDTTVVESIYARWMTGARSLEAEGYPFFAFTRYVAIAQDLTGLHDVVEPNARIKALAKHEQVVQTARTVSEASMRYRSYMKRLSSFIEYVRASQGEPPVDEALRLLDVADLKQEAEGDENSATALAARRILDKLHYWTGSYESLNYLEQGDATRALGMLEIAQAIKPGDPTTCYDRARALTLLGRSDEAIDAVACVVQGRIADPQRLVSDPAFEHLRTEPRFQQLVAP